MHIVAAKHPFDKVRIFGGLDQQIVLFAQNGANDFEKHLTNQNVDLDILLLLVRCDQGFQFGAAPTHHR